MTTSDIRGRAAPYYDLNPQAPDDVGFYTRLVPSPTASVLELGCGTGRVLLPLAERCGYIQGIDQSEAMLDVCRDKLRRAKISEARARVAAGDISDFNLGRRFDFVIAPYRVLQNLETDAQLDGIFRCIHAHLLPGATCVLNVLKPKMDAAELRRAWATKQEALWWEREVEGGRVTAHERRGRVDPHRLIIYPELIWRRYQGETLVDETALQIPMRCYYPDEFTRLITDHGFRIIERFGGYAGEAYGDGPELVVRFEPAA